MRTLSTILILVAALVNLAPVSGVLSAARLETLYGLAFDDPNLVVLMRHRALLFGIVGGLLVAAAFHPPLRALAVGCGLFSMLTYVAIAGLSGETNDALQRILWIDVAASVGLVVSFGIDRSLSS